jgi:acyl carrier protein
MDFKNQLRDFILSEFGEEHEITSLAHDEDLIRQGLVDSVGVLQIISFIEQTFHKRIADDAITVENFRSIDAIANLVARQPEMAA